jgi:hypothetical protein
MVNEDLFRNHIPEVDDAWPLWVPAEHISRQAWQEAVEAVVADMRKTSGQSAFGLKSWEVSIYYHQPLGEFARELRQQLT